MSEPSVERIENREALDRLVGLLAEAPKVGVDTESNAFHAWRERVCLIQISVPAGDFIVDTLAVDPAPLAPLFADPEREVIFHAAEYDVRTLKRDHGFEFNGLFDTQIAAMLLGSGQVGYGPLVAERLGIHLAKEHQRSDWGRRPLSAAQLAYAAADARYLIALRDQLVPELEARGRMEEARAHFRNLADAPPAERSFDETGYFRLKGFSDLDAKGRAVARALYLARERVAEALDVPPFKTLNNDALVHLAQKRPSQAEQAVSIPGVSPRTLRRWGDALLGAIAEGVADPEPPPARPPRVRRTAEQLAAEERYERLRKWRSAIARKRGIPVQLVAPSGLLRAIAREQPGSLEALAAVAGMDAWRVSTYGQGILETLGGPEDP